MIKNLAIECRMPFCYGGGITTVEQAIKIISLGAEKVALSNSALNNLELCQEIGAIIGNQSVVVVIDVKKKKFFNLGPENNWKNLLDKKTMNEIETKFSAEMKELGYLKLNV